MSCHAYPPRATQRRFRQALTALLLLACAAPIEAAHRLALVIGNDNYQHADVLRNARSDARAIAATLTSLGFAVTLKQDVTQQQMKVALRTFKAQISGGDEVVFYFSGHGVQFGGTNYLIPVDLLPQNEEEVADDSVGLQRVLDDMSDQKARFSLAIIDACRENPFKSAGRSIGKKGLVMQAATGQMVMYSAGSGQEALDHVGDHDTDPNGLFTRILIREIKKPGVTANQLLKNVSYQVVQVAKTVNHEQVPALYDQTIGDYYFVPGGQTPAVRAQPAPPAVDGGLHVQTAGELEQEYWNRIKDSTDQTDFSDYQKQFPQGPHAAEAALALRKLKQRVAAAHKGSAPATADIGGTPVSRSVAVSAGEPTPHSGRASVTAGTYSGYSTSSLSPGAVLRGRLVLSANGDFEGTGSNGVKARGSLDLSRPDKIQGTATVTQPKVLGVPIARYPDGSSTTTITIRAQIVGGMLRGHYSDAFETGEIVYDLNNPL